MSQRIPVFVYATDPVSQAGIAAQLRGRPELHLLEDGDVDSAIVAVLIVDDVDADTTRIARAIQRNGCPRVVLVATRLDDAAVLSAVEAGACALLRRGEASPERLASAVQAAAAGDGNVPPDLLGRLLAQVSRLHRDVLSPRGLTLSGMASREIDVLRLVADGLDTNEIADKLCYSERTVKNVIHDVTTRLNLRNRSHAVAYAMRMGLL